jgi:hypothetical protein
MSNIAIDKTEKITNTKHQKYSKNFKIDYLFEVKQEYKLQVYSGKNSQLTGEISFVLSELLTAKNKTKTYKIIS